MLAASQATIQSSKLRLLVPILRRRKRHFRFAETINRILLFIPERSDFDITQSACSASIRRRGGWAGMCSSTRESSRSIRDATWRCCRRASSWTRNGRPRRCRRRRREAWGKLTGLAAWDRLSSRSSLCPIFSKTENDRLENLSHATNCSASLFDYFDSSSTIFANAAGSRSTMSTRCSVAPACSCAASRSRAPLRSPGSVT
jgi:hypothetical protein